MVTKPSCTPLPKRDTPRRGWDGGRYAFMYCGAWQLTMAA